MVASIANAARPLPAVHDGGLMRPVQVAPVEAVCYLGPSQRDQV